MVRIISMTCFPVSDCFSFESLTGSGEVTALARGNLLGYDPWKAACLAWQAQRCAGHWFTFVLESLATIHDPNVVGKFITIEVGSVDSPPEDEDEPWIAEEIQKIKTYMMLLIELASARSWSQIMYSNCSPNNLASIFHPDQRVAQQLLNLNRTVWTGVLAAEGIVYGRDPAVPKDLKAEVRKRLCNDVCWNQLQLAREAFIICDRAGWVVGDPLVQQLGHRMFGVPANTKFDLEDLFAHLASVSKTSSLATPMSKSLDWL